MTATVGMAALAGMLAVLGAWEVLAAVDERASVRAVARWLAPLRRGGEPTAAERRRLVLVGVGTLFAAGWLLAGVAAGLVLAAAGPTAVAQVLAARRRRRAAEAGRGAAAVARALADALAGGHSVRGAISAAARSGGVPGAAGDELRRAAAELELGEPTDEVLEALRRRAADRGWDALVAATLLHADAGGDLAVIMRGLSARLEESRRAEADARSVTAQARFTAWLVAALPAGAALLAELAAPGYLASLASSPLTATLVAASLALQVVAVIAIRRIA
jgi:tight adherence protein B